MLPHEVYRTTAFNKRIYWCDHQPEEHTEYLHDPSKFLPASAGPCSVCPTHSPQQPKTCFAHYSFVSHTPGFLINGIIQYVFLCLSSSAEQSTSDIYLYCRAHQ